MFPFFPFLHKKTPYSIALCLFLVLTPLTSVRAQENFATYPPLPSGYSSIKVFDNQGRFAGRILPEKRYWVPINRIPPFLQKAVVAVEDARFYEHGGIDVRGIARALVKDVVKGKMAEGGSTITQQLIKNKHLSGEKTLERKLDEARLAMEYEKKYTKPQILEMYFNEIYYGNGAWGIAQAARFYFDKNPEELTDAECALLAGVPKNPGRYNPLGDPSKVAGRRDVVLKRMTDLNMITPQQKEALRAHLVAVTPPRTGPLLPCPHPEQADRTLWTAGHRPGRAGSDRRHGPEPAETGRKDPARGGEKDFPPVAGGVGLPGCHDG